MKSTFYIAFFAAAFFAANAQAMKVSNLDKVPHTVVLESAGTVQSQTIAPGSTVFFTSQPEGFLSLQSDMKKRVRGGGNVHADGMLSGIIGAARTEGIPTHDDADFVIWPGGQLQLQIHRHYRQH